MNLRDTDPLPTCLWCPECGWTSHRVYGRAHVRPDWNGSLIPPAIEEGTCGTTLVEVPIIPPGADLRSVLAATGADVREGQILFDPSNRRTDLEDWEVLPTTTTYEGPGRVYVVRPRGEVAE